MLSPLRSLCSFAAILLLLLPAASASAETRYVWQDSPSPAPPYTNWTTAAHIIQDAVDAAQTGDTVLVAGGLYATGGRPVGTNLLVNRVAIDRAVTVESLMGPEVTIIQGYQVPGTTNGDGAIRCVYLTDGASLSGFTLANGATRRTGWLRDDSGGGLWCESASGVVSNCVLVGNSAATQGGGAWQGTLYNCALSGNSAGWGGGAAGYDDKPYLHNCTLTGNSAGTGGGVWRGTLNNCMLTGNSASGHGGGAAGGVLLNCTVTGNSASIGGGVGSSSFFGCRLTNCIVYFNTAAQGQNYVSETALNSCCTTPHPDSQQDRGGNITLDPQLASASHLSVTSPCRGAGNPAGVTGTDIDGEAWANPPSIGCDEYHAGAVTGPLSVSIVAAYTNVAVGFPVELTALIEGRTTASVWEFGGGVALSNRPYASHAWTVPGDYTVVLRAYNESLPGGVSASVTVQVVLPPVYYVSASGTNPVPPYASWVTAATNIQDAVDAVEVATVPGAWVLVTNGVYATGGRAVTSTVTNRVAVDKPLAVRSVNGPELTIIQGYQLPGTTNGDGTIRCVYLANGASLSGFTLTNGAADSGGGLWCESANTVVSNCVLAGNSASHGGGVYSGTLNHCTLAGNWAQYGGGAYWATLNNCMLTGNSARGQYGAGGGTYGGTLNQCALAGNSASDSGGGAYGECALNNCTLTGNLAESGGGAMWSTLNNCIVYFNLGDNFYDYGGVLNNCCTTPMPPDGVGNITNAPLFVDHAGGNLRLQSNSPCINAGNNAYVTGPTDLDGNPRIVSGTVDIGAYEFQGPGSVISYAWLQQYGLPTDGSADTLDSDLDGHTTWQEWRCQTDPTNTLSVLRLLKSSPAGSDVTVKWQSVEGVSYFLERSTNLAGPPPIFAPLATSILGQPGTTSFTDTNAPPLTPSFYRVGVGD